MTTYIVQIGNTDDKLSQVDYSRFVKATGEAVARYASQVFFSGTSDSYAPWQNACWVFSAAEIGRLEMTLSKLCGDFNQDSFALTTGRTEFIGSYNNL